MKTNQIKSQVFQLITGFNQQPLSIIHHYQSSKVHLITNSIFGGLTGPYGYRPTHVEPTSDQFFNTSERCGGPIFPDTAFGEIYAEIYIRKPEDGKEPIEMEPMLLQ